jgi:hypothetical protein
VELLRNELDLVALGLSALLGALGGNSTTTPGASGTAAASGGTSAAGSPPAAGGTQAAGGADGLSSIQFEGEVSGRGFSAELQLKTASGAEIDVQFSLSAGEGGKATGARAGAAGGRPEVEGDGDKDDAAAGPSTPAAPPSPSASPAAPAAPAAAAGPAQPPASPAAAGTAPATPANDPAQAAPAGPANVQDALVRSELAALAALNRFTAALRLLLEAPPAPAGGNTSAAAPPAAAP